MPERREPKHVPRELSIEDFFWLIRPRVRRVSGGEENPKGTKRPPLPRRNSGRRPRRDP